MEPMILFWAWVTILTVHIGSAVALYHMAERRFNNGFLWAWMGLLFSWLALLIYLAVVVFDASMDNARATAERARVNKIMAEHRRDRAGRPAPGLRGGEGDLELERLLAAGRYDAAREHAAERLRLAHELGDQTREDVYRGYLRRIDEQEAG